MFKFSKLFYLSKGSRKVPFQKVFRKEFPLFYFTTSNISSLVSNQTNKQWEKFQKEKVRQAYNFSQQSDLRTVVEKYKRFRGKLTLNEEIVFLDTLANIVSNTNTLFQWNQFPAIDTLLSKVKIQLKNSEEDYPLIGSLLYSMDILNYFQDQELWMISTDYVIDHRMNSSFDELIYAFQGIANMESIVDKSQFESYLQNLEDLFIQNYPSSIIPLANLEKICQYYSQTQKTNFDFIEILHKSYSEHLLQELSTLKENNFSGLSSLIKISYFFARWGLITSDTSSHLQDIVESYIIKKENNLEMFALTSEVFSLLTYAFGMAIMVKKTQTRENILNYMREYILDNERKYQLQHLEYLHKYFPVIGFQDDEVYSAIRDKISNIDPMSTSLEDIENYLDVRALNEHDGDYNKVPQNVFDHLDQICKIRLKDFKPKHVYKFFGFLDEAGIRSNFPHFWNNLPEYIVANIGSFDFEEMCYLYFIYAKHGALQETGKFKENLEILKDYIVLHYRSIPRGKLDITSHFYKVLEVVDIYKFYEKGDY